MLKATITRREGTKERPFEFRLEQAMLFMQNAFLRFFSNTLKLQKLVLEKIITIKLKRMRKKKSRDEISTRSVISASVALDLPNHQYKQVNNLDGML